MPGPPLRQASLLPGGCNAWPCEGRVGEERLASRPPPPFVARDGPRGRRLALEPLPLRPREEGNPGTRSAPSRQGPQRGLDLAAIFAGLRQGSGDDLRSARPLGGVMAWVSSSAIFEPARPVTEFFRSSPYPGDITNAVEAPSARAAPRKAVKSRSIRGVGISPPGVGTRSASCISTKRRSLRARFPLNCLSSTEGDVGTSRRPRRKPGEWPPHHVLERTQELPGLPGALEQKSWPPEWGSTSGRSGSRASRGALPPTRNERSGW